MAYTEIHPIIETVERAIAYALNDKIKLIKDDVADAVAYAEKDKNGDIKIFKTLSSALNCSVKNPKQAFDGLKNMYGSGTKKKQLTKNGDEILAWHCIQSFEGIIDPAIANEIGRRTAEEVFGDFACIISTHTNTENTHNHIVFGAWGMSGKKYHDCIETYRKIRNVSDQLCREYGLPVMEHTEDYKLIRWTDEQGKVHYYEPTDRKNALRDGQYGNANDYRNTEAYTIDEMARETNRNTIKSDIDKLLPTVNSYEELIEKLRGIGYQIKDKKKNGEWRVHISFQAPMQDKPTREDKIGDGEFYTRERLTEFIKNQSEHARKNKPDERPEPLKSDIALSNEIPYSYGAVDIDTLDEEYRKRRRKDKIEFEYVHRGIVEKILITDVKYLNQKLNEEYKKATQVQRKKKTPILENRRSQYLLDCINANLRTLHFVEQKNIRSFEQIQNVVSILYDKRNIAWTELDKIKTVLQKANKNVILIKNAEELKKRIEQQKNDPEYVQYEMAGDLQILNSYEAILKQRNLFETHQQEKLLVLVERYNRTYEQLAASLESVTAQIQQYDDCVYTLNRVDREHSQQYQNELHKYYEMKEAQDKKQDRRGGRE